MHQRETLFMWKKNKEGVPWDIPSDDTGTGLENGFLLHEKFFFFAFFSSWASLSFSWASKHVGGAGFIRRATDQKNERKKKKERNSFSSLYNTHNILRNHNVHRAIRIYDCGKYAYSNAIIVCFDRIIVRVKVKGEREAEARDCCREKLPHLSFQLY